MPNARGLAGKKWSTTRSNTGTSRSRIARYDGSAIMFILYLIILTSMCGLSVVIWAGIYTVMAALAIVLATALLIIGILLVVIVMQQALALITSATALVQ